MKPAFLSSVLAALCLACCAPGPDADTEPVAGSPGDPNEAAQGTETGTTQAGGTAGGPTMQNGIDVNRIRLPDMEKLPTDRELTTNKDPGNGNGGVIARPPSE